MPPRYSNQLRNTVEKLRSRLLDLTGRNPSISFRHSASSRKQIRIIDEVPDQLFSRLVSLKDFEVKGIPVPDLEPQDEKTEEFQRYLKIQMKTDRAYLKAKEELGEEPTRKQIKKLEFELRDRVRAALNMAKVDRDTRPPVKSEAEKRGINTSFDLPLRPTGRHHADSTIQTLKYDDDLEADLSSLFQFSELIESETGTLPLFLAIGFLEWYESDSSDKAMYSPLILLPVEIKRVKTKDRIRYFIGARDSEPLPNLSLIERMGKDFGLVFPVLNDADEGDPLKPTEYFRRIAKLIATQSDWKIHSWATVSVFSFTKMAMYKELESSSLDSISSDCTPLEGMLLSQETVDENHTFSADYEIEDSALKLKVPQIISSADVSQISAIIDVLDGKNLVIEGPPGTGKSQTITNMIAALIGKGKSVLFVAEKRAALTVVKERLANARLGPFCLELHSSKAKRKEVVESLERRLKVRRDHSAEEVVSDLERQIQTIKSDIGRYIGELNHYHEPLKITLHDIVWKLLSIKDLNSDQIKLLQNIEISGVERRNKGELDIIANKLKRLGSQYNVHLEPFGGIKAHPWFGMLPKKITVPYLDRYFEYLSETRQILFNIKDSLIGISRDLQRKTPNDLDEIVEVVRKLETYSHHDFKWTAPLFEYFGRDLANVIVEALKLTTELDQLRKAISGVAPGFNSHESSAAELSSLIDMVRKQGYIDRKYSDVAMQISELEISKQNIESALSTFHNISNLFGFKIALNLDNLNKLYELCQIVSGYPLQSWEIRNENLIYEPFKKSVQNLLEQSTKLKALRDRLSNRINLDICRQHDLYRYAGILSSSNIFSWFSSEYRQIKKELRKILPHTSDDRVASQELYDIAIYFKKEKKFENDPLLKQIFPDVQNRGVDSDFDGLATWLRCFETVVRWIQSNGFDHQALIKIVGLDKSTILELRKYALSSSQLLMPKNVDGRESLEDKLNSINRKASYLSEIQKKSMKYEITPETQYEVLESLLDKVMKYERCKKRTKEGKVGELLSLPLDFYDLVERGAVESFLIVFRLLDELLLGDSQIKELLQIGIGDWMLECRRRSAIVIKSQNELKQIVEKAFLEEIGVLKAPLHCSVERIDLALASREKAQGILDFQDIYRELQEHDINPFIEEAVSKNFFSGRFDKAFELSFYSSLVNHFYEVYPKLFKSVGIRFDEYRMKFKELDDNLIKAHQSLLSTKLCSCSPPEGNGTGKKRDYTEMSLVRHLTTLERPNVSVRDLLARSSNAIKILKPVFLMSPLSVAQTLPPNMKFDVLIMDEASQMRPEDALGSIARCSQVVVVGDPKQMPPSDYFSKSVESEGEESPEADHVEIQQESILDLALAAFQNPRRLKWHYRSKNEELIAFSNHYFYENDLVIFPSAKTSRHLQGVVFEKVGGIYSSGRNPIEAKETVDLVIKLIKDRPTASIMIVAMNQKQSDLINELLLERVTEDPVLEKYIDHWNETLEPLLVRNLENVQGDERDIVVISTVYGPDSNGHVFQRFGPIGAEYGHRRLNVLYTRAKELMIVVSSLDDTMVVTGPNSSKGVHALKNFLRYARTKQLGAEVTTFGVRPPDSEFEIHVANKIREYLPGVEVVAQVGVAGFFIDLAIKHPTKDGAFLLGIECDGKTYHSSKSARDRDKIRQKMLEDLGWNLHRIWSTDWFTDPDKEMRKLIEKVEALLNT